MSGLEAHQVSEADVRQLLAVSPDADAGEARTRVEAVLDRGLNYRLCVRELHESLGVSDEVIAAVAGVHAGTVRRWRSSDPEIGEPRHTQAQAIDRLRMIALVLVKSRTFLDLRGIGVWLQAGRHTLNWRPPFDVLATDREHGFRTVVQEATQFVNPGGGSTAAGFGPPRPAVLQEQSPVTGSSPVASPVAQQT